LWFLFDKPQAVIYAGGAALVARKYRKNKKEKRENQK